MGAGGRRADTSLVWSAAVGMASGYGEEARAAVLALDRAGSDLVVDPLAWAGWEVALAGGDAERIERLVALDPPERFAHVIHATAESFYRHPAAICSVGRTMYETDRIPYEWVARCNDLDEVWVPSSFNLETFASSGVDRSKLVKLPPPLRPGVFDRPADPLVVPGAAGFVFLAVGAWDLRKGWDVLVRAYVSEFGGAEDVSLVLVVPPAATMAAENELRAFVVDELERNPASAPRMLVCAATLSDVDMPRLYRAADAFVLASRGEGWGRPYMEAMACGVPTIGTRWGGNLEFMDDDNSYLVDCTLVDVDPDDSRYAGHRWAQPSVDHLREQLRRVTVDHDEARRKAERARQEVLDLCAPDRFAEAVLGRLGLDRRGPRARKVAQSRLRVAWHGDQFAEHSFAGVNRDLVRALLGTGRVEVDLVCDPPPPAPHSWPPALLRRRCTGEPDAEVHVQVRWPPDFRRPQTGAFVVFSPWEWGAFPRRWIEPLNDDVDELWVPTRHVRDAAVGSGVPEDRVAIVPHGVDPLRCHPHVAPLDLPTEKPFRFLFAGGAIKRKGCDIALRSYVEEFDPADGVCLVVTDMGARSFYRNQTLREEIRALQRDPGTPEILYLGDAVPVDSMPSLYAACDCLVAPYRAEGFGLPIAEAMACGRPVVVPAHGAALDYCHPGIAYLVPAEEMSSPERRVAEIETTAPPRWAEIDRAALRATMRAVNERPDEARLLGDRASEEIRRTLNWRLAADAALARLDAVRARVRPAPPRRRAPTPRPRVTLSGCTMVRDAVRLDYPLEAALLTYLPVCDEIVVAYDSRSDDGTADLVADLARRHPVVRPLASAWTVTHDGGAEIARQANVAIAACRGDWVLHLQADEALHEDDHGEIRASLAEPDLVAALFDRRMFLDSLDREIPSYRTTGLLRLFRRGAAWAVDDGMTCRLEPGEQRLVFDGGWRMFDYGRVGAPEMVLRRKRAAHVFSHASEDGIVAALEGELEQRTARFDPAAHPRAVRDWVARTAPGAATLGVLLGPGEVEHVRDFVASFAGWAGDVVVLDDTGGDGGCAELQRALVDAGVPADRTRIEPRPPGGDFAEARNRVHALARHRWILHADVDELWDERLPAELARLTAWLDARGKSVCGFPRANFLDGVLVNDLPPSEWTAEALRQAADRGPRSPEHRDHQYRLVRRHERWRGAVHERPVAVERAPGTTFCLTDMWIRHPKTLQRQRRQDERYRALAGGPASPSEGRAG